MLLTRSTPGTFLGAIFSQAMLTKLPVLLTLPLVLLLAGSAWQHIPNNLLFAQLEAELPFWGQEGYHPTDATRTRTSNGIAHLTTTAPENPNYWTLRAGQQAWEAWWAEDQAAATTHNKAAADAQWQALQSRPAHGHSWQKMLEYAQGAPGQDARITEANEQLELLQMAKQ